MRQYLIILSLISIMVIYSACTSDRKEVILKGTWYYDRSDSSKVADYTELYFNDTIFYFQNVSVGRWFHPRRYKLTDDSIFFEDGSTLKPYYKILKFSDDTLFLHPGPIVRPAGIVKWVRMKGEERGYFEHVWSSDDHDSLMYAVRQDWHRRMMRFHYHRSGNMKTYDSLLRSGYWNFTMKDVREEIEYIK
ncbi:MAG: hypothetical protein U0289_11580 [Cyclobacteriaceae bacterium]|nr:hypothetical protein [Cytophagales bacterium]HNP76983.1 hypothetical protein [Cyclobacteriaceae bacterium]